MCRPIRDHRRRRPRHLNGSWDDVLAHICLPTIPAKLSAQVSVVLHSSISREDARAWNYNGIDRNRTEDGQRAKRGDLESPEKRRDRDGKCEKSEKCNQTSGP